MEVWCSEVVFVHAEGAQRGSTVPEGTFVHGQGHFCGCGRGNVAACPRRGCFLWKSGAGSGLLSTGGCIFVDAERE